MIFSPTDELLREQAATLLGGFPIQHLGPEQERLIGVYREEYFKVGSCTDPADRPRAERAITALYESHGMEAPRFEWGDGPQWGVERVDCLGDSLRDSLVAALVQSLWDTLVYSLWDSLKGSMVNSLWDSLMASLVNPLWGSLRASIGNSSAVSLDNSIDGGIEVCWIAHYLYCADVLRLQFKEVELCRLRLHDEIARSVGLWWPYQDVCVCTERPKFIRWYRGKSPKLVRAVYRDGLVVEGK